jgi:CRP-like cAMP-binding protein/Fe-S-cluster-containing hydrogenase component 2
MTSVPIVLQRRRVVDRQGVPADPAYLATLPFFESVPEKARAKVVEKVARYMTFVDCDAGQVVLEEGEYNDSAYYVLEGAVEVLLAEGERARPAPTVKPPSGVPAGPPPGDSAIRVGRGSGDAGTVILSAPPLLGRTRTILEPGEIFGEISALSRYPVSATVVAAAPLRLLRIQLRGLKTLSATSKEFKKWVDARYRDRALLTHLRQVPIFEHADEGFLRRLKDRVELLSFESGQVIVQEGAAADAFYLVRGGYVKVAVGSGGPSLAVTYLRKGDFAGESALLLDEPWPFTLIALESVEMVKIPRVDFQHLVESTPAVANELWGEVMARMKARGAVLRDPVSSEHMQMAMDTGLVHGESVLLIDLTTCTRCDDCVRGCADTHGGMPRFIREGDRYRNWLIPTSCYQCTDPVCMIDCPTGAITREFGSLEVTINPPTHPTRYCIGCGGCAKRCPWGNIVMVPLDPPVEQEGRKVAEQATKCDKCLGREEGPACVQMCPHGSAVRVSFRDLPGVSRTLARSPRAIKQAARPKEPRNLLVATVAAASLCAIAAGALYFTPWNPKSGVGLFLGILGALAFFFAMAYPARRRRPRTFGTAKGWLQAHVYVAGVGFVAALLHAGGLPHGWFGWTLLALSAWVVGGGLIGVVIQKLVPATITEQLRVEALYERIPALVEAMLAEADARVEGSGARMESFYRDQVRPVLQTPQPSWSYLLDPRGGRERTLEPFRRLAPFLEGEDKEVLDDLLTIVIEKLELDAQYRLQYVLRRWLGVTAHVVAGGMLMAFLVVHIAVWLLY